MLTIPNRPFSTENITGLMLPDGIFEITLGNQRINAHVRNETGQPIEGMEIYIEGISDPGIGIAGETQPLGVLAPGAEHMVSWDLDLSGASPGTPFVSFVVDGPSGRTRIFKKIFVTQLTLDNTGRFTLHTPEGSLAVKFDALAEVDCCASKSTKVPANEREWALAARQLASIGGKWRGHTEDFTFCPPPFLPIRASTEVVYTVPFDGQYGPLPFEDPFWKIIFCIIGLVLLIASAIAEGLSGSGSVEVNTGNGETTSSCKTCGVGASGGGTSYVAAALLAAAATAFSVAAASDARDPWRRGQDATMPEAGEKTVGESVQLEFKPIDDIALGKPFKAGLDWSYTRNTDSGATYETSASDEQVNIHTLEDYEITANNVYPRYSRTPWVIEGRFEDEEGHFLSGAELLVQCFLCGPNGEYVVLSMQDDGQGSDATASDGTYTGSYYFDEDKDPQGIWTYFVIAQDMNTASPDMTPDEAAQIIGGLVRTNQLTVSFSGGTCPLVPDGHVHVI